MNTSHSILWVEGTMLGQQHLQQWDEIHRKTLSHWMDDSDPLGYGWLSYCIDSTSLIAGQVRLLSAEGIFQNRQRISYVESAQQILSYTIPPKTKEITIGVIWANNQYAEGIKGYPNPETTPGLIAQYEITEDRYDHTRSREIVFSKPKLVLGEIETILDDALCLPLVRIINDGTAFKISHDFIPPIMCISASSTLLCAINGWIELTKHNTHILESSGQKIRFEDRNILAKLYELISFLVEVCKNPKSARPYNFYQKICLILSYLKAYENDPKIQYFPDYDHTQLTQLFYFLNKALEETLLKLLPKKVSAIQFHKKHDWLYTSNKIPEEYFQKYAFYLGINRYSHEANWIKSLTNNIKIGSDRTIEFIVESALSGASLTHVTHPPQNLILKPGYTYFYLEPSGSFWNDICMDRTISVFLTERIESIDIEISMVDK